ncbi:MAG: hypothetical protein QM778_18110 [Myxococcales bacterium]
MANPERLEVLRTSVTQKCALAANIVNARLAQHRIGDRRAPRVLQVSMPDAPSSQGGRTARQAIRLVTTHGPQLPLMCGWLEVTHERAELRTYASLAAQHRDRFGRSITCTRDDYSALMGALEELLSGMGIQVVYVERSDADGLSGSSPAPRSAQPGSNGGLAAAAGMLLVLSGIGFAWLLADVPNAGKRALAQPVAAANADAR